MGRGVGEFVAVGVGDGVSVGMGVLVGGSVMVGGGGRDGVNVGRRVGVELGVAVTTQRVGSGVGITVSASAAAPQPINKDAHNNKTHFIIGAVLSLKLGLRATLFIFDLCGDFFDSAIVCVDMRLK